MAKEPGASIITPPENIYKCPHQERIDPATHIGVCKLCGQERQYDPYNSKPPVIIKEGRVPEPEMKEPIAETVPEQIIKEETKVSEPTESALKPDNWPKMGLKQRKKWYDEHKQEILTDMATIDPFETRRKWGLTHSTLDSLLKRWGEPPLVKTGRGKRAPQASKEPAVSKKVQELLPITMPSFPAFNDSWLATVQIEWFKSYLELKKYESDNQGKRI